MAFKIDATLLDDPNDPPLELLRYLINEQQKRFERFNMLQNYYRGKHAINKRDFKNTHDTHVMVNHAKYITDMITGMMTGNPISYVAQDGRNIDAIIDAFSRMNIAAHDTELEQNLSCYGIAYEMPYLHVVSDTQTEERMAILDPRRTFVVTDDTEDEQPLFGVYLVPKYDLSGSDNGYLVTVYGPQQQVQYRTRIGIRLDNSNIMSGYPKVINNPWGDVPIIEYLNNRDEQGDFEQQISSIDAYNSLQSDRISDKDAFVDAILLGYGTKIEGKLEKGQMLDGLPSKAEGTSIEWLTKTLDESATQILADSTTNDIHEMSNVPNMNDKDFAGNISGEAMKYKLFGLLNLISIKEQFLMIGLHRRLALMQNMMRIKSQDVDIDDMKIQITPNIPVNMSDTINNIKNADGIIPRVITYGWLQGNYDPHKMFNLMQEQNKQQLQTQKQALGGESTTDVNTDEQEGYRDDSSKDQAGKRSTNNQD